MRCEANRKIYVEFGEVETGATAVKWLEIVNESCIEQIYEARRDATTNPLDHVFELCGYSWSLLPGQTYKCKIYYRPFVPFAVNVDYFTIVDSAGERAEIQVRGTCIGPLISSSATRLVMMCTCENREAKKRIRLVNDSKATATFMFDVDPLRRPFEVNPQHGYIEPHSRKCVTITFAPREDGIYACHFPCLILNHKPIIIELYGYCCTALRKTTTQSQFNYPSRLKNGFEGYTSDTVVATQDLPTVSSSKNCIDFGQAEVEEENAARKIPETLCLTNHSQSDVLIKWDQDVEGIFSITPAVAKIPASQTALFEVAFSPNRGSSFFTRDLVGDVFVEQQKDRSRKETLEFPTIMSVRLIGHSFPVCSDGWIPQYEIPHVVKMPPCIPSSPTYATFLIRKYGHLPLMYHFVPPASSHFVVKPMMGIIHQDYQIIVVGMLPGTDDERVYMERWAIRFNGNTKSECFIDFQGYTEYANVNFSDRNIMCFAPTFPGCQSQQQFCMRNITRHTIQYEFINVVPELQMRNGNGKICSNGTVIHEWLFCPAILGDYEFDINCVLVVLRDGTPVGPSVCVTLHVTGRCEFGFLVVTDLQCYGPYPDVSKVFLWKLMKMNTLNMLLRDLQPEMSQTLHINFPVMVLQKSPVTVKLLLTNAAAVIASWNIKRVQLCSCRPIAKTQGFKFQRAKYDCLHRKVCSVQPKTGNLKPGEEAWITLELRYILLGKTEAKWDLDLGDNRHIFFIIMIECLSDSDNKLHFLYGTHFKFQPVFFGEKDPIYQVCWVHNGTNHSIPFSISLKAMREINQEYCYKVFSCAIPHVIANPHTSVPILLKFQPRQFGIFKGKLRLTLGDEEEELTVVGESSLPHKPTIREYVPCERNFEDDENIPVYFSTDCINISHIATHSHVVKMVMMHNNLVQDVLAYEWKRREISEIIHVEIFPRKGLIKPMSVKSFRVTIYTKGYPCIIDIDIPCEFINASQRRVYQRSVYIHEGLSQELEGQFTITEKGISVPELPVKIELEKPQPFYKIITIQCSVYSMEDKFLKVSLMKELTSAPPKGICLEEENEKIMTFGKEDISRSSFIIEGLLWEIVNSKLFKDLMQDILREESNLFYSQFRMSLRERKRLIQRSYISPPRALINRIFEEMLFVIMHEEFALKTAHLVHHTDVRHTDYLNMVPSVSRKKTIRRGIIRHILFLKNNN
ncbi:cilia- and flagella-associated protein 65 [Temnothorax longispinosus]|uniref:cilia- and flagella-associated protein 65 n=1 Tax=Temnothorax longispinosus TaxID=300112 RepID=UPI003A9A03E2